MKDRFPCTIALMLGFASFAGWRHFGWGPLAVSALIGALLYALAGFVTNALLPKAPKPNLAPADYDMGRILLYCSFLVFLISWLRMDFNSAVTSGLYFFIPWYLALKYITSKSCSSNRERSLPDPPRSEQQAGD